MAKISTRRNPRARFDEDKPMRFRVSVGNIGRGELVPRNINAGKLRRWWNSGIIERADIQEKYEIEAENKKKEIVEVRPIGQSGWFNVTYNTGEVEKLPRSSLKEDHNIDVNNSSLVVRGSKKDEPKQTEEELIDNLPDNQVTTSDLAQAKKEEDRN